MKTETKSLLAEARTELKSLNTKMDDITSNGTRLENGGVVVEPGAKAEFKSTLAKAKEVREFIEGLEAKNSLAAFLDEPAGAPVGVGGMQAPQHLAEQKSLGQRFVDSAEFKARKDNGDMYRAWEVDGGILRDGSGGTEFKDIHSGSIGTFTHPGFGSVERAPMVQAPMRSWRVRDLFPQMSTNSVMIEYVEELGFVVPGDNAAATVAERTGDNSNFGLKPKSNLNWTTKQAPIRTIAHWVPAHRNVLDDEPQLRGIIDTRLRYGLMLEEDRQFLLGNGVGENVLGILNTPGVQQYPGAFAPPASDTYIDAIRRAITRVMLAEYEATGIVVHPSDWEKIELTKDEMGRYVAVTAITDGAVSRLWKTPVVATPAIPEGTALIGAFGLGAQIFDRMQSTIRTSEHHDDFFVRNAIVVLAEERTGLAVYRPEAFVELNLENSIA